jgi:hypothetical protein
LKWLGWTLAALVVVALGAYLWAYVVAKGRALDHQSAIIDPQSSMDHQFQLSNSQSHLSALIRRPASS